ncbi:MAG: restriction endonuclease subunit S [Porphyromonadaceae bacterium]|nr:restriction endonuclease subunit S [Porphyromonadaceae bacterium]
MIQGDKNSLPKGWEMKKLGEVCEIKNGRNQSKVVNLSGKYPIYGSGGIMGYADDFICEEGCTVIGRKGSINNPIFVETKFWNVDTAFGFSPLNNLLNKYLYYFCTSFNFKSLDKGTTLPSLTKTDLLLIELPLPPIEEQQRIVAKLDEAFEAIEKAKANAEQNLKNARELFESYLQAIFENKGKAWEEVPLANLATFRNGMNFTKSSKGEEIKIVGVRDFQNSFWVPFENLDSVIIDGELNDIDLLREDDILVVRSNGNPELIGRTLLAGSVEGKVSHSGFTIRIRLNSKSVSPVYLCNYLKTQKTRKELINRGNGVGIKSLNQGSLASLSIPFPPLSEQQTIVQKLDALSDETKRLEAICRKKLEDLDELKKSILQKAFSGQL